jgi:hypothetical protein
MLLFVAAQKFGMWEDLGVLDGGGAPIPRLAVVGGKEGVISSRVAFMMCAFP